MNLYLFPPLYLIILFSASPLYSQQDNRPEMAAAQTTGIIKLDGVLDEPDWEKAPVNDRFKTIVPVEGGAPSGRTQVRVLAHPRFLVIGVQCFDDDPKAIVNYSIL